MKEFIKNHPYLSCAGLAVVTNAAFGVVFACVQNKLEDFFVAFIASTICSTIPAIGATIVDRLVHQNLFDNKPLQYGLTAAESILGQACMFGVLSKKSFSKVFTKYFTNLVKMDLSHHSVFVKSVFVSKLIQSLGFKYIIDSAAEQSEISTEPGVEITPEKNNLDANQDLVENHF